MIKAIETVYNGYKFRSRLEARWAVFFDSLELKYSYEHEGFDIYGLWYLPDFYMPSINYTWIEIKPRLADDEWVDHPVFDLYDHDDDLELNEFTHNFIVLAGNPYASPENIMALEYKGVKTYLADSFEYEGFIVGDNNYRWCECPYCNKIGLAYDGRSSRLCNCTDSNKEYNTATPRLMKAYTAARQARFGRK